MSNFELEQFTPFVARILRIDDVTTGDTKDDFVVRYRGRLLSEDSEAAYDQLAEAVRSLNVTPIFRMEDEKDPNSRHVIFLRAGVIQARPSNPWINIILLVLTLFSVLLAGAIYAYDGPVPEGLLPTLMTMAANLGIGLPFAISLMAILLAHEFGHYFAGRFHKTHVTLPYFIPFPFSPFGTMGAFIQMKEIPRNRRHLLDIGLAGPLAGVIVAIPVLLIGLSLSKLDVIPHTIPHGQVFSLEGNSILYLLLKWFVKGQLLPAPAGYDIPAPLFWLRYIFTGYPLPLGGLDVMLHPIAWAGWAGLLVTSLNLIPAGQLDGGHLLYVLMGRRAVKVVPFILVIIGVLGFFWSGWWLWALLIFLFGRIYAEPLDLITPLDGRRKLLALIGLIVFVLVFIPVPLIEFLG
jgi:membrane-associated protease RseP (regulator of RpoE activity)